MSAKCPGGVSFVGARVEIFNDGPCVNIKLTIRYIYLFDIIIQLKPSFIYFIIYIYMYNEFHKSLLKQEA